MKIDIYPVGLYSDLLHIKGRKLYSRGKFVPDALGTIKYRLLHLFREFKDREWRSLRMYFNGYLAEPSPWPTGLKRCGSGWTRTRALGSLCKHIKKAGL